MSAKMDARIKVEGERKIKQEKEEVPEPVVRDKLDDDMRRLQIILDVQLALRQRDRGRDRERDPRKNEENVEVPAGSFLRSLIDDVFIEQRQNGPKKAQTPHFNDRSSSSNGKGTMGNVKKQEKPTRLCIPIMFNETKKEPIEISSDEENGNTAIALPFKESNPVCWKIKEEDPHQKASLDLQNETTEHVNHAIAGGVSIGMHSEEESPSEPNEIGAVLPEIEKESPPPQAPSGKENDEFILNDIIENFENLENFQNLESFDNFEHFENFDIIATNEDIDTNEEIGAVSNAIEIGSRLEEESPNKENQKEDVGAAVLEVLVKTTSKAIQGELVNKEATSSKEKENIPEAVKHHNKSVMPGDSKNKRKVAPKASVSPSEVQPKEPRRTRYADQTADLSNYLFKCPYCINKRERSVTDIYTHWMEQHNRNANAIIRNDQNVVPLKPFSFEIRKVILCYYCDKKDELPQIALHYYFTHLTKEPNFATIDSTNPLQCGECSFTAADRKELPPHSKKNHNHADLLKVEKPTNHLTDALLNKLGSLQSGGRKNRHGIRYWCSQPACSHSTNNDELEMTKHVLSHNLNYKCHFCDRIFEQHILVVAHHKYHISQNSHLAEARWEIPDVRDYAGPYEQIRLMLPNGFTFTKKEAANTRYGDMTRIFEHVDALRRIEMDSLEPSQEDAFPGFPDSSDSD